MSLRQTDAPQKVGKARIVADSVQTSVCRRINGQIVRPVRISPIEPCEGLIFVSQTYVNHRDVVRRDVVVRGKRFQMIQHLLCFGSLSRHGVRVTESRPNLAIVLFQFESMLKLGNRFRQFPFCS